MRRRTFIRSLAVRTEPQSAILQDMRSSGGSPRDLTNDQVGQLRALFLDPDIGHYLFCREIFGFADMTFEFHGPPCQLVGHWGRTYLQDGSFIEHTPKGGYEEDSIYRSYRRIMITVPRETFKSSAFTRAGSLYTVAKTHGECTIGMFNETQDKPIQWIDAIRLTVENSLLFQTLWRDLIPRGIGYWDKEKGVTTSRKLKWGGTGMLFERSSYGVSELTIEPHGIGGTAVGKHFTHMLWDDLIGLKAQQSPAVMQAAIDWVDNSRPLERPAEGGCVLVCNTRWAYRDAYCWAGESRVWMSDGSWKPICDVEVGDRVIGFEKVDRDVDPKLIGKRGGAQTRTKLRVTEVVARGSHYRPVVTHLLDDSSTFRCTEDHKFFKVWKSGRGKSDCTTAKLTDDDYAEVRNLTRLRKVMDPFGACPDDHVAGWLGGMYDADGTYSKNRIAIYQSIKHYPEICDRIRDSLDHLGITFREYYTEQESKNVTNKMMSFVLSTREARAKFLAWCNPTKHRDKIEEGLLAYNAMHTARVVGRSEPELDATYWIETTTGNYICEGLASKNSHILDKWPGEWITHTRALLENPDTGEADIANGVSTFPTKISTKKAKEMAARDLWTFSSQYQNQPRAGRTMSFDPAWDGHFHIEWIGQEPIIVIDKTGGTHSTGEFDPRVYELDTLDEDVDALAPKRLPLSWCEKCIILDPAPSKGTEVRANRLARNGITVNALDPWGRRFNLQAVASTNTPQDLLDEIVGLAHKWQAWTWSVEEVNFSAVYEPLWRTIMSLRSEYAHLRPVWIPVSPKARDKEARIRNSLISGHETGIVYYNMGHPDHPPEVCDSAALVQEKNEFPYGATIDLLDSFAYLLESVVKPMTPAMEANRRKRSRHSDRGVSGYGEITYERS